MSTPHVAAEQGARLDKGSTFSALRATNFRLYWLGLVLYVLGYRAEFVTFGWMMWQLTNDPLDLAYLGLAQGMPLVLLQTFGGVLADRVNRLRLLIGTQTLTALTLTGSLALAVNGLLRVEHLFVLSALTAVFRAFDEPSRMALIPQLIERDRLPNAIALGSIPWQGGRMIGPFLAGVLIAAFGGTAGFVLAALASYGALALYSRIRIGNDDRVAEHRNVVRQYVEGFRFVGTSFFFSSLIGLAFVNSFFGTSYVALLPIYADEYFRAGSWGYGLLQTAHGLGAVVGSLVIATVALRLRRRGLLMLLGAIGAGLLLMLFSYSSDLLTGVVTLTLMGVCSTTYLTLVNTLLQQNVPDQLRGRVLSIFGLSYNLIPLGGVFAGGLAAAVDARFAILVGGALVASSAAVLLLATTRLRSIA